MNNEVKILSLLEQLQEGLSGVKEDLQGVKEDLQGVKEDLSSFKVEVREEFKSVRGELASVKEDLNSFKVEVREEFKDIRGELKEVRAYQFSMGKRLEKVEVSQKDMQESIANIRKSQLKVELEQFPRIAIALDGVHGATEKNIEQDGRIFDLEEQVEQHDIEITALKSS